MFDVYTVRLCYFGLVFYVCRGRIQRKSWCMGPYAGIDYNHTLCPLQSRLQHIYLGQPYARVDLISQSGTLDLASDMILYCSGVTGGRTVGWKTSQTRCSAMSTAHRTSSAAMWAKTILSFELIVFYWVLHPLIFAVPTTSASKISKFLWIKQVSVAIGLPVVNPKRRKLRTKKKI